MKILALIVIPLVALNCTRKEESCTTDNYLINNTNHSIQINFYSDGILQDADKVELNKNESKNVFSHFSLGKKNTFSYGQKISIFDSAILLFDDTVRIKHYSFKVDSSGKKGLGFEDIRNIINPSNYSGGLSNETKHTATYTYKFTFTEQDFLNAKKK